MKSRMMIITGGLILACSACFATDIVLNATLKIAKGNLNITRTINVATNMIASSPNVAGMTQIISSNTVGTAITLGDVATNGVAWFGNLSSDYWVDIGVTNAAVFYPLIRINPGEAFPWRVTPGIQPYARAQATTTNVVIEKLIFDN